MGWKKWPRLMKGATILIIITLLILAFLLFLSKEDTISKNETSKVECYSIDPNKQLFHDDYYTNARNDCFYSVAIEKRDVSLCEEIKDRDIHLYDGCLRSVALESQNADICEMIVTKSSDWKENCIIDVAISKNDSSICNRITNYQFETCLEKVQSP